MHLLETLVAMPYYVCFHKKYILSTHNDVYMIISTKRFFTSVFFHCRWGKHDNEISHFWILGLGFLLVQDQQNLQWIFFSKIIVLGLCIFQTKKSLWKSDVYKESYSLAKCATFRKKNPWQIWTPNTLYYLTNVKSNFLISINIWSAMVQLLSNIKTLNFKYRRKTPRT